MKIDSPIGEAIAFGVCLPEAQANAPLPPTSAPDIVFEIGDWVK